MNRTIDAITQAAETIVPLSKYEIERFRHKAEKPLYILCSLINEIAERGPQ